MPEKTPAKLGDVLLSYPLCGEDLENVIDQLDDDDPVKVGWGRLSADERVNLVREHASMIKDDVSEQLDDVTALESVFPDTDLYSELKKKGEED